MTRDDYEAIELGMRLEALEPKIGTPYEVHYLPSGKVEYEYIERIRAGKRYVLANHYFLIVQDGIVVGKRWIEQDVPQASYDYVGVPNFYP